jgi:hypothetical protein
MSACATKRHLSLKRTPPRASARANLSVAAEKFAKRRNKLEVSVCDFGFQKVATPIDFAWFSPFARERQQNQSLARLTDIASISVL